MRRLRRLSSRCSTPSLQGPGLDAAAGALVRSGPAGRARTVSRRSSSLSRKPWYCSSASSTDSTRSNTSANSDQRDRGRGRASSSPAGWLA